MRGGGCLAPQLARSQHTASPGLSPSIHIKYWMEKGDRGEGSEHSVRLTFYCEKILGDYGGGQFFSSPGTHRHYAINTFAQLPFFTLRGRTEGFAVTFWWRVQCCPTSSLFDHQVLIPPGWLRKARPSSDHLP